MARAVVCHVPTFDPQAPPLPYVPDTPEHVNAHAPQVAMEAFILSWKRYNASNDVTVIVRCDPLNFDVIKSIIHGSSEEAKEDYLVVCDDPVLDVYEVVVEVLTPYAFAEGPLDAIFQQVTDPEAIYESENGRMKAYIPGVAKSTQKRLDTTGVDFYQRTDEPPFTLMFIALKKVYMLEPRSPDDFLPGEDVLRKIRPDVPDIEPVRKFAFACDDALDKDPELFQQVGGDACQMSDKHISDVLDSMLVSDPQLYQQVVSVIHRRA